MESTGHKYDKYVIDVTTQYSGYPEPSHHGAWIAKLNGDNFKGCNEYLPHWIVPECMEETIKDDRGIGHPPHVHKEVELIFLIGSDAYHPEDLGGSVTMSFGEEMEEHIIDRTSCIYVPSGLVHGFYRVLSCHSPFIFFRVHHTPRRTEFIRKDKMTEVQIANLKDWSLFQDIGFEDEAYWASK